MNNPDTSPPQISTQYVDKIQENGIKILKEQKTLHG